MNKFIQGLEESSQWRDRILLFLLLSLMLFSFLGSNRPFIVPDEGRYVEIPREMITTQDYITPRINGIKYFEKPALFYWIEAGAIKLLGQNEFSLRLPVALLGLLGCLATYLTAKRLFNEKTGYYAALILVSSPLYLAMAHTITLDLPVSTFLTTGLFAFLLATQTNRSTARYYYYAFYTSCAFAVLTKGLIGLLLPGAIIFSWMLLHNQWFLLKRMYLISGTLLFLALTIPWHWLVQKANPEFFQYYFIDQQFGRYLTLNAGRYQPIWFFAAILLIGFYPWSVFIKPLIKKTYQDIRNGDRNISFIALWAAIILVFFSLSNSKLAPYILPAFPPLAILTAAVLNNLQTTQTTLFNLRTYYFILPAAAALITIAAIVFHNQLAKLDTNLPISQLIFTLAIFLIGNCIASVLFLKNRITQAIVVLTLGSFLTFASSMVIFPKVYVRSIKPLAMSLKPLLTPEDKVASFRSYYQDLPFYLERQIVVAKARGELSFGMQHQDTSNWMIDHTTLWRRWANGEIKYLIVGKDYLNDVPLQDSKLVFCMLSSTTNDILFTNRTDLPCQPLSR